MLCVGVKALLLCLVRYDLDQMLVMGWHSLFGFSNITLYGLAVDCSRPAAALNALCPHRVPEAKDTIYGSTQDFEPEQARWFLPQLSLLLGLVVLMAAPLGFGLLPVVASVVITAVLLASLRPSNAVHGCPLFAHT